MNIPPEKMPIRPRHEAACFSEEDFLEFSDWTNQTFWFPQSELGCVRVYAHHTTQRTSNLRINQQYWK